MSFVGTSARVAGAALAAVALAVPAQAATTPPPGDVHAKIIDGQIAQNAPWAARLFVNGQEECTATIIAPEWVLTAQHCVAKAGDNVSFNIGSLNQHEWQKANAKSGGVHIHDPA